MLHQLVTKKPNTKLLCLLFLVVLIQKEDEKLAFSIFELSQQQQQKLYTELLCFVFGFQSPKETNIVWQRQYHSFCAVWLGSVRTDIQCLSIAYLHSCNLVQAYVGVPGLLQENSKQFLYHKHRYLQ